MTARARTCRAALVAAVCAGLAATGSACATEDPDEGTNGVGKLSAAKIERSAKKAAGAAEAVRLSGSIISQGRTYRLDMRLNDSGGVGEVSTKGGSRFELLRVDEDLFLKADAEFWVQQEKDGKDSTEGDREAARKLDGKYVKVPPGDPAYKQLSGFTDINVMLDGLLVLDGARATGERGEVGGVRTVRVTGADGEGGKLDVALIGTPYPLRLERGGGGGVVEMADWDKEFPLRAPDKNQVVDYGRQITAGGD
ncbi:hypothetical protein QNO07_23090 [Streptomyces sp. 549]|uniref:hypothetical protein n=1 Tax=Streptomyces sp. 549 TaxID=3049076 RepID=UPI0024C2BC16|nr:hypothetical protein [Streptomyces sp. 549]MDK1476269.1 hypothetical protein [Streptomyces sp. 549]